MCEHVFRIICDTGGTSDLDFLTLEFDVLLSDVFSDVKLVHNT